jgi:hypothetical protein
VRETQTGSQRSLAWVLKTGKMSGNSVAGAPYGSPISSRDGLQPLVFLAQSAFWHRLFPDVAEGSDNRVLTIIISGIGVLPRYSSVPFTRLRAKGGVYQFRYQLPVDVAAHVVGSFARTVIFSLGSRDPLVARSRALRAAADINDIIAAVRAGTTIPHWPLDPAHYQRDHLQSLANGSLDRLGRSGDGAEQRSPDRHHERLRASPERPRASQDDLPERLKPSQERPARERRGKRQAQRDGRGSKGMTLLTVYNDVYLPRREERKGAPPRRRTRLDYCGHCL